MPYAGIAIIDLGVIWLLAHVFPSHTPIPMCANIELGGQTYNHNVQTPTHKHLVTRTHTHIPIHSETHRQTNRPISCWPTVPSSTAVMAMHDRSTIAAIAQVGERQTEDLKVPVSIPGLGTCLPPSFSCPVCFFVFLSV